MNLKNIADYIAKGYTSGYYPNWYITYNCIEKDKISQSSLNYISKSVIEGFTSGEIIENDIEIGTWAIRISEM
jgi:hypothetical protein